MIRLPENFFDGAEALMTGNRRAGMALAAVLAGAIGMGVSATPDAQAVLPPTNGAPHFSLVGSSPGGNRVRLVGEGSPESVEMLRGALVDYASDGDMRHLSQHASSVGATISVTPAVAMAGHDSRSEALAAISLVMLLRTR